MADIYFYQEEGDGLGGGESTVPQDEGLHPLAKLEKFAASENIFNRQMVARTVLETLRQVNQYEVAQVGRWFDVMDQLAGDSEPSVRAELMEQVPHIAMYCQEMPSSNAGDTVPVYLLPLVVRFLTDTNNQVRKTSQAALLVLLEQGLADIQDVEEQVCPVILRLTEAESDDLRTEAVALLSKMAPLIGQELSEKLFLQRFADLSGDPLFHVRKVCAANFGDFSGVVGSEATERVLLPKFFYLCEDGVWGVRKACADVFMPVSCVCSPSVRQTELSPLFINLLQDQSRWVRMAAFQALGPFISTFADPEVTALLRNENGEIVVTDSAALAVRMAIVGESTREDIEEKYEEESELEEKGKEEEEEDEEMDISEAETWGEELVSSLGDRESPEEIRAQPYLEDWPGFTSFLYWREPLCTIPDELIKEFDTEKEPSLSVTTEEVLEDGLEALNTQMEALDIKLDDKEGGELTESVTNDVAKPNEDVKVESNELQEKEEINENVKSIDIKEDSKSKAETNTKTGETTSGKDVGKWLEVTEGDTSWESASSQVLSNTRHSTPERVTDPALPRGPPETEQCIVPQLLIDHYVSMVDPSRAQTVDNDIARHCAFSLPAVALTLGRTNWPLLKETYESLANDMQWKVRRTLASSIHELAVILGPEVATKDLVPIFNGFIKDLDEVRIGVLKHLSDFLGLLSSEARAEYLPRLEEFLKMDNERNWRFRLELCQQVATLVPLCSAEEVLAHLAPLALLLIQDRVSEVRRSASEVTATLLVHLTKAEEQGVGGLARVLITVLATASHWARRQTFVYLCGNLLSQGEEDIDSLSTVLIPSLLALQEDPVPNVRISLGAVLQTHAPKLEGAPAIIERLQEDPDRDVRASAGAVQESHLKLTSSSMQEMISLAAN